MGKETRSTYEDPELVSRLIQSMVMIYKKQFEDDSIKQKHLSDLAAVELLRLLKPFKAVFFRAIKNTDYSYKNICFKIFMSCCIENKEIRLRYQKNELTQEDINYIKYKLRQIKDVYGRCYDDMFSDFNMMILVLAKRYQFVEGKTFRMYIESSFPYELYRHIKRHFIDEIVCWKDNYVNIDEIAEELVACSSDIIEEIMDNDIVDSHGFLNNNWMAGNNCSDLFEQFTEDQRRFIVMYFQQHYPDRIISEICNKHINTVNQTRRKALRTLETKLDIECERERRSGKSIIN